MNFFILTYEISIPCYKNTSRLTSRSNGFLKHTLCNPSEPQNSLWKLRVLQYLSCKYFQCDDIHFFRRLSCVICHKSISEHGTRYDQIFECSLFDAWMFLFLLTSRGNSVYCWVPPSMLCDVWRKITWPVNRWICFYSTIFSHLHPITETVLNQRLQTQPTYRGKDEWLCAINCTVKDLLK
jgi:hypothetical protein